MTSSLRKALLSSPCRHERGSKRRREGDHESRSRDDLSETLIHAGPRLTSGSPRYSLVYGYTAPFMQTWHRYDPPADLLERVTPRQRQLLAGERRYGFRRGQF